MMRQGGRMSSAPNASIAANTFGIPGAALVTVPPASPPTSASALTNPCSASASADPHTPASAHHVRRCFILWTRSRMAARLTSRW